MKNPLKNTPTQSLTLTKIADKPYPASTITTGPVEKFVAFFYLMSREFFPFGLNLSIIYSPTKQRVSSVEFRRSSIWLGQSDLIILKIGTFCFIIRFKTLIVN